MSATQQDLIPVGLPARGLIEPFHRPAGAGRSYWGPGDVYTFLVTGAESGGLPMNELAARILSSKSGLTRVVDRMEEAGLVRRERPPDDRRVVRVLITPKGIETLQAAREVHHLSIHQHFTEHLSDRELTGVANALGKVHRHVRPLRPERIGARTPAGRT